VVVQGPPRGFRAALADAAPGAVPLLHRPAVASGEQGRARKVELHGVDARLDALAGRAGLAPPPGVVRLSEGLVEALVEAEGDRLVLRVERPSSLTRKSALTKEEGRLVGLSVEVGAPLPPQARAAFAMARSIRNSVSGAAAARSASTAARPRARANSSGSILPPSAGRIATRPLMPAGRMACAAFDGAARPAGSPSKSTVTSRQSHRLRRSTCSGVSAVPHTATALRRPSWSRGTSM
jgi:hypothetical protein